MVNMENGDRREVVLHIAQWKVMLHRDIAGPSLMTSEKVETLQGGTDSASQQANTWRFAGLYRELHELAERRLRRNGGAPLSPTTLLHEAYLSMAGSGAASPDRERFLGYAARVMRGLVIDFVRERRALKRGSGFHITRLPTRKTFGCRSTRRHATISRARVCGRRAH